MLNVEGEDFVVDLVDVPGLFLFPKSSSSNSSLQSSPPPPSPHLPSETSPPSSLLSPSLGRLSSNNNSPLLNRKSTFNASSILSSSPSNSAEGSSPRRGEEKKNRSFSSSSSLSSSSSSLSDLLSHTSPSSEGGNNEGVLGFFPSSSPLSLLSNTFLLESLVRKEALEKGQVGVIFLFNSSSPSSLSTALLLYSLFFSSSPFSLPSLLLSNKFDPLLPSPPPPSSPLAKRFADHFGCLFSEMSVKEETIPSLSSFLLPLSRHILSNDKPRSTLLFFFNLFSLHSFF